MLERSGQILRIACLVLLAVVVYELAQIALGINPLAGVVIPALPTLASSTNSAAQPGGTNKPSGAAGTNSLAAKSTNAAGSNIISAAQGSQTNKMAGTNSPIQSTNAPIAVEAGATNTVGTNVVTINAPTNTVVVTNAPATTNMTMETNNSMTNLVLTNAALTNVVLTNLVPTNLVSTNPAMTNLVLTNLVPTNLTTTNAGSTNLVSTNKPKGRATNSPAAGARAAARMAMGPGGIPGPELPPDIKARVDRIYDSEILGQIIRPQPMGLMGIAGDVAFLRSATGQTGMVKEGDTLGDLKLVRIGTNRVLVEVDGKKQELMIFEGYGGESLLPKEKETPK